jgi:Tol biopolymer transport system component
MARASVRIGPMLLVAVAVLTAAASAHATFPGRNGAIAYVSNGNTGGPGPMTEIRSIEIAARGGRGEPRKLVECRLTDGQPSGPSCTEDTYYSSPSFSADGRRIVFDTGAQLAVIDAAGSDLRLLPGASADDGDPAFSPDGKRIVFTGSGDDGATHVYIRRVDGGPARVLVYDASAPAWSSRDRIAYVREGNIYSVDPNGRRRQFVTSGVSPDWSPNGRLLLVVRPPANLVYASNIGRIYVVGANGRVLRRIGSRKDLANPVWSPDGRWLAFHGFELGVHRRRATTHAHIKEIAPTQSGDEGGFVTSYGAAWQPR